MQISVDGIDVWTKAIRTHLEPLRGSGPANFGDEVVCALLIALPEAPRYHQFGRAIQDPTTASRLVMGSELDLLN